MNFEDFLELMVRTIMILNFRYYNNIEYSFDEIVY